VDGTNPGVQTLNREKTKPGIGAPFEPESAREPRRMAVCVFFRLLLLFPSRSPPALMRPGFVI
jgi:hypothetical protein